MRKYHKIQSVFKRDPANNHKTFLMGEWSEPAFGYLAMNDWEFTEKVDGTNIRVMVESGGAMSFGGKTDNANMPAPLVARLQERFLPQQDALAVAFPNGVCLYGEGYGGKIQKGSCYRPDQDFVLFDVLVGDCWLQRRDVEDIATKLSLDIVPVIGTGTLHDAIDMTIAGFKSRWGEFAAEGLVARPSTELRTRFGDRVIVKVKHRDFTATQP